MSLKELNLGKGGTEDLEHICVSGILVEIVLFSCQLYEVSGGIPIL